MQNIVAFPASPPAQPIPADPTSDSAFMRCVLESSTECIKVLDLDARLTFMTAGGLCVMEIDDFSCFEGADWIEFWQGEDRKNAAAAVVAARAGGVGRFQGFCRTAKGTPKWWDVVVSPIPGPDGRPDRLLSISRDVTNLRKALDELERKDERYRLVTRATNEAIWDADIVRDEVLWSESTASLFRYRSEEIQPTGAWWKERLHPEDRERVLRRVQEVFTLGEDQWSQEYRFRRGDGTYAQVLDRGCVQKGNDGHPNRLLGAMQDISEQRRLEEQFRHSQKVETLGRLTGGIAHDFNNLLTVVIGNTEVLAEDAATPEHKALAQVALEAAEKGARLTQQLLAFARRQSLQLEPVLLDEVVRDMLGLLRRSLGEHVEIRSEMSKSRSTVLADRHILQSALLNLSLNARDAMPQGGTITITTGERRATAADGRIPQGQPVSFVTVSDVGVGIPPDILEQVFEPFFTTKDVGKGSGLGLSMVQGFAEQSGGHVSIESKVGQGTSVTLVLPVAREAQAATEQNGNEATALSPKVKHRLLVVEDEPQVLQFVTGQLIHLGHEVTAVSTAADALALLSQGECFDLLFTDVVLPKGMSGVELARRASTACPSLKVLLTSGYSEDVFEQHGRPPEGTPLLRKPYRRKDLAQALDQALG